MINLMKQLADQLATFPPTHLLRVQLNILMTISPPSQADYLTIKVPSESFSSRIKLPVSLDAFSRSAVHSFISWNAPLSPQHVMYPVQFVTGAVRAQDYPAVDVTATIYSYDEKACRIILTTFTKSRGYMPGRNFSYTRKNESRSQLQVDLF